MRELRQLELLRGYRFRGGRIDRSRNDNRHERWWQLLHLRVPSRMTSRLLRTAFLTPRIAGLPAVEGWGAEPSETRRRESIGRTDDGADWETSAAPEQLSDDAAQRDLLHGRTGLLGNWKSACWRSTDGGASQVVAGSNQPVRR